jgi:hypothetical protein
MNKKLLFYIGILIALCSCEDVIEPAIDNHRKLESGREDPAFGAGLLYNAYTRLPTNNWTFSEMATDDAVSSNEGNEFSLMANGRWASNYNPMEQWQRSRSAIQYINLMLSEVDSITFSDTEIVNHMFRQRTKGEAYALRAIHMYHLLQGHGGMADGSLLGVPIVLEPEDASSDFNKPRASFEECMQQLYSDIEKAIELLPLDYGDIGSDADVPSVYASQGATKSDYDRVFGNVMKLRLTGRIIRAVKAQAALLAASPAFSEGTTTTWADAANYAADVIDLNGGIGGIDPDGVTWYDNRNIIDGLGAGANPKEILWRNNVSGSESDLEANNFPPTLYGRGLVNPSQNLVDAFPMADGYPIGHPLSTYDANNPYLNRDPRLQKFIIVNGSTLGPNNTTVYTSVDGGTNDGLNRVETSTRTGYYLRKLLRGDVNLNPSSVNGQRHIKPHIRYTEIYLIFAEAANEAWGPMAPGPGGYSAYDVIRAIRERAGITGGDPYLESIKGDQDAMRQLIRNERRLELSFEGFRFWDLRRWKENLTETAKGVQIQGGNHQIINVEQRAYGSQAIYGPVPYSETLKFSALQQNTGW